MLDDFVDRMKVAGERFDQGWHVEARVLAAQIGTLVHDEGGSRALMPPGLRNRLGWVDTAGVPNPKTSASAACLTLMKVRSGASSHGEYVPKLGLYPPAPIRTRSGEHIDRGSRIPFDEWWTNPVLKDADGAEFSRKQLVLALATHAGAARDPEMAAAHAALSQSTSLGWVLSGENGSTTAFERSPVIASIRQVGYEVVQTITQQRDVIADAALG